MHIKELPRMGADFPYMCMVCGEPRGVQPRKPYTGVLNVRLTPEIHSGAAMAASKAGITINAFIKNAVARALGLAL
jgi:predicted HicB family RNase H-like nuclease